MTTEEEAKINLISFVIMKNLSRSKTFLNALEMCEGLTITMSVLVAIVNLTELGFIKSATDSNDESKISYFATSEGLMFLKDQLIEESKQ